MILARWKRGSDIQLRRGRGKYMAGVTQLNELYLHPSATEAPRNRVMAWLHVMPPLSALVLAV